MHATDPILFSSQGLIMTEARVKLQTDQRSIPKRKLLPSNLYFTLTLCAGQIVLPLSPRGSPGV